MARARQYKFNAYPTYKSAAPYAVFWEEQYAGTINQCPKTKDWIDEAGDRFETMAEAIASQEKMARGYALTSALGF
jgi:hypothetical protein